MNLEALIEQTAVGLGYELVDFERAANGLLRVFIDEASHQRVITIEDCEALSRQLTYLFEVENVAFERLEVSSPGMDRPLKKLGDFARFAGDQVAVRLKLPVKMAEDDAVGRKNFSGVLLGVDASEPVETQISMEFEHEGIQQVLSFGLADVDKARLIPVYDFKGKKK